jgi:NADH-quinone oxidoreductase subunit C
LASWGADSQSMAQTINETTGADAVSYHQQPWDSFIEVPPEHLLRVVTLLKTKPELNFNMLANLSGVDAGDKGFTVVYHLESWPQQRRVTLKVPLPRENPRIDSICRLYPAANWNERELYDMFGIAVPGHPMWNEVNPDAMRILCSHGWQGFPLRKDYVWADEFEGIALRRAPLDPRAGVWVNQTTGKPARLAPVPVKQPVRTEVPMQPDEKKKEDERDPDNQLIPPVKPVAAEKSDTAIRKERRMVQRERTTVTPPHGPDNDDTSAAASIAPHLPEHEPVTEAEFVTIESADGKSTIVVERKPGCATHATIVGEGTDDPSAHAPQLDSEKQKDDKPEERKGEDSVRKGIASRRMQRQATSMAPKPTRAEDDKKQTDGK